MTNIIGKTIKEIKTKKRKNTSEITDITFVFTDNTELTIDYSITFQGNDEESAEAELSWFFNNKS